MYQNMYMYAHAHVHACTCTCTRVHSPIVAQRSHCRHSIFMRPSKNFFLPMNGAVNAIYFSQLQAGLISVASGTALVGGREECANSTKLMPQESEPQYLWVAWKNVPTQQIWYHMKEHVNNLNSRNLGRKLLGIYMYIIIQVQCTYCISLNSFCP